MPKCSEGTYRNEDGTYFSVSANDLWDKCPICDGYHPKDSSGRFCHKEKSKGWWAKFFDLLIG